jgi:hypothetical protein
MKEEEWNEPIATMACHLLSVLWSGIERIGMGIPS